MTRAGTATRPDGSPREPRSPASRGLWYAVLAAVLLVAVLLAVVRRAGEPPVEGTGTGGSTSPAATSASTVTATRPAASGSPLAGVAPSGGLPAGLVLAVDSPGPTGAGPGFSAVLGARECEHQAGEPRPVHAATWSYSGPAGPDGGRPAEGRLTLTLWSGSLPARAQLAGLGQDGGACRWLFPQERLVWHGHDDGASWLSRGGDPRGIQVASAVRVVADVVVAGVGVSADGELAAAIAAALADGAADRLRDRGVGG